jgi:hypothetical protein
MPYLGQNHDIGNFLQEYALLAYRRGLTDQQKLETIIQYIHTSGDLCKVMPLVTGPFSVILSKTSMSVQLGAASPSKSSTTTLSRTQ